MLHHVKNYILTLVCATFFIGLPARSATSADIKPDPISASTPTSEDPIFITRRLNHETYSIGAGAWLGAIYDSQSNDQLQFAQFGVSLFEKPDLSREFSFELGSGSYLGWSTGYKFLQEYGHGFEPYLKISLGALYSMNEGPGTLLNWQRYQLRGEAGWDDLFGFDRHWRGNLGFNWSGYGASVLLALAYVF